MTQERPRVSYLLDRDTEIARVTSKFGYIVQNQNDLEIDIEMDISMDGGMISPETREEGEHHVSVHQYEQMQVRRSKYPSSLSPTPLRANEC